MSERLFGKEYFEALPSKRHIENGPFFAGLIGEGVTERYQIWHTMECKDFFGLHPLDLKVGKQYRGKDGHIWTIQSIKVSTPAQIANLDGEVWTVRAQR